MALLTKPSLLTSLSKVVYTLFNTVYDDLYDKIGNTVNGRGSLTYINVSPTPDFPPEFITGTAAVLGGGTEQVMTNKLQLKQLRFNVGATNQSALTTDNSTLAVDTSKTYQMYHRTAAGNLDTITGGSEGDIIGVFITGTAANTTIVHTAAATANKIRLKGEANSAALTTGLWFFQRHSMSGASMWHEI